MLIYPMTLGESKGLKENDRMKIFKVNMKSSESNHVFP